MLCWALDAAQITSLKNLGLNIRKAALKPGSKASKLFVTDANTSEKILKSSRLEEIRMTIINNMLYYHPVRFLEHTAWTVCVACFSATCAAVLSQPASGGR